MIRALALVSLLALAPTRARADWDAQLSVRLLLGGGAFVDEQQPDPWPFFELGLRADVLLGEARPDRVRFGPAIDLRTEDYRTFEAGGGLALYLPTGLGFGIVTTVGAGWGARPENRDGAFGLAHIALGYRPYNYFSVYGYGVAVYAGARVQLERDPRAWEVSLGVEIDAEFLFAVPIMFVYGLANARDPDEPETRSGTTR